MEGLALWVPQRLLPATTPTSARATCQRQTIGTAQGAVSWKGPAGPAGMPPGHHVLLTLLLTGPVPRFPPLWHRAKIPPAGHRAVYRAAGFEGRAGSGFQAAAGVQPPPVGGECAGVLRRAFRATPENTHQMQTGFKGTTGSWQLLRDLGLEWNEEHRLLVPDVRRSFPLLSRVRGRAARAVL